MNYFLKTTLLLSAFCILCSSGYAGVSAVHIFPDKPGPNDTITLIYYANTGNQALAHYQSDIFIHTGLITSTSSSATSWKHVMGEWGTSDQKVKMNRISEDTFMIRIHPRSFYSVQSDEDILKIACVFRNADGSIVGKDEKNQDFFIDYPSEELIDNDKQSSMNPLYDTIPFPIQYQNFEGYFQDSNGIVLHLTKGKISIQRLHNKALRVSFSDQPHPPLQNPYGITPIPSSIQFISIDFGDFMEFRSFDNEIICKVDKNPVRLSFIHKKQILLREFNGLFEHHQNKAVSFELSPDESIFGGGSRALPLDKRGYSFPLYNTAVYGYANGAEQLNATIPLFISNKNYGLYLDTYSAGRADIGFKNKSTMKFTVESGSLSYIVFWGESFADIVSSFTDLSGHQPLPPIWSLGFIQSKYGYKNQNEAIDIVKKFKKAQIPLDALVLDLYWFGKKEFMGNLDWDNEQWPNPKEMIASFDSIGVKTILITEPYFIKSSSQYSYASDHDYFAKNEFNQPYIISDFWAGPASLLDIFNNDAKKWMSSFYKKQLSLNIGGWWSDLGEPENHPKEMVHTLGKAREVHNIYSMFWSEMLWDVYKEYAPQTRLFNLCRAGYTGMQRYSTFPWSGDIQRSNEGLQAQIPIMLTMGLNGVGYMHSDLGGFTGGPQNDDLYIRWLQFGAFCPIMRAHGEGVPSEPVNYPDSVLSIVREYIKLRTRFLPYNYTLAWENSQKGFPLARPIFWNDIAYSNYTEIQDEYLWGNNILIAPILEAGKRKRNVILPHGNWFDYWSNTKITGNSSLDVLAPISALPIFIKAGTILPLTKVLENTQQYKADTFYVLYYRDTTVKENTFDLFTDNGKDPMSMKDSAYRLIEFKAIESNIHKETQFSIQYKQGKGFTGEPSRRAFHVNLINVEHAPISVKANNISIKLAKDEGSFLKSKVPIAWYTTTKNNKKVGELHIRYSMNGEKAPMLSIVHSK